MNYRPARAEQTIRVLLAEDEALAQRAIAHYLSGVDGITLIGVAKDGIGAVALARRVAADVAIVDIHMPHLNGIEATKQLTREPFNLKVLCFTALANDDVLMQALDAGASGFLLKSDPPELIQHGIRAAYTGDSLISPRLVCQVLERAHSRSQPPPELSPTDLELIRLIGLGLTNAQISSRMGYSISTVKTYVSRLLSKLNKGNRAGLATLAFEWGLVGNQYS